tara:strand:- start:597 stop:1094 length:498 start_codon:yes stop_codon:yes gene_type:complete
MNKIIWIITFIIFFAAAFLVFKYDNKEKLSEMPQQVVNLYYYNPELDTVDGSIMCSDAGLVAVERTLTDSQDIIRDTLELLLTGELSNKEMADGVTTEFPLVELEVENITIDESGLMTLTLSDPTNATVGGSCRVAVLFAQIQATATQFDNISEIEILPADLFQP